MVVILKDLHLNVTFFEYFNDYSACRMEIFIEETCYLLSVFTVVAFVDDVVHFAGTNKGILMHISLLLFLPDRR